MTDLQRLSIRRIQKLIHGTDFGIAHIGPPLFDLTKEQIDERNREATEKWSEGTAALEEAKEICTALLDES